MCKENSDEMRKYRLHRKVISEKFGSRSKGTNLRCIISQKEVAQQTRKGCNTSDKM
jgi:hypothetical protein